MHQALEAGTGSFAEALDYLPELATYDTGPDRYLELVTAAKRALADPGDREPERHDARRLDRARPAHRGRRRRRARAEPLPGRGRPRARGGELERRDLELVAAVRAEIADPARGEALALLHGARALRRAARRGRRRRPRALQPLLPARPRPRDARGHAAPRAVDLRGAAAAAALDRAAARPADGVPRRDLRRPHGAGRR